ncbi:DUF3021 family protein [Paenibacillus wynnii]|uniref:DUF3021 domain-containing protein n=1 Tax=Paenibacillus wynnii TaxID=268407 RepID=A0A098M2A6_9BACL|nr:DUF3021 family protein [Paenibacillus wynnii]KGE16369.1 hypothetical protein PWYN_16625 [Paenibacillus wynnii]
MKLSKYLMYMLKDFIVACGSLMILALLILTLNSNDTINTSLLWQIVLGASAYTFYKNALVNTHELGKRTEMITFCTCFVLADVMVLLWLWFFSTNNMDSSMLVAYLIVIILVKGLVYAMMYTDGKNEAKQLNEKLSEFRDGLNEGK